jgi:hypothetical protein
MTSRMQRVRERAYGIWEQEGRPHGNDWAHWFQAEALTPLRVTFDSNAYRQAVDPNRSRRDASLGDLLRINAALVDGRLQGFLSETVGTLEGVRNTQRGSYFSSVRPKVGRKEQVLPDGTIKLSFVGKPDNALHPQLPAVAARWVSASLTLGLKFLYAPRFGAPRPAELLNSSAFEVESNDREQAQRQERFSRIAREIEARGLGFAVIKGIGSRINTRLGITGPWLASLGRPKDVAEEREIQEAVKEWADGDTAAAHYAYDNDYLCSADVGGSTGGAPSIFDAANRAWLTSSHNVQFVTLAELATMV